jgi:hypothetical protein
MIIDIIKQGDINIVDASENYWYFAYILETKKLINEPIFIKKSTTATIHNLFAATTESECTEEIEKLKLTL